MGDYPEHEKMAALRTESEAIGDFLADSRYSLCDYDTRTGRWRPIRLPLDALLAEHFSVDLAKIEDEKAAMLRSLR